MTVLEKIKRCVSLVWDFQEFYGDEDIEDFCSNELDKYSQYNEILDYFKRIADLEKENAELKEQCSILADCNTCVSDCKTENIEIKTQLTKAKEIIKLLLWDLRNHSYNPEKDMARAEEFLGRNK